MPGDITYKEWYNKYVKPHETPTGKGDWGLDDSGQILATDFIKAGTHYRTLPRYKSNAVVEYYTYKKRQKNYNLYDENGFLAKQINLGDHNNRKQHLFGKSGEHAHDVGVKNGKLDRSDARELTKEERRMFLGGDEVD